MMYVLVGIICFAVGIVVGILIGDIGIIMSLPEIRKILQKTNSETDKKEETTFVIKCGFHN